MTTQAELKSCLDRISAHVHRTPVMSSRMLNELSGANIVFKCENFQRTGSFKFRGATNAILSLTPEERERGVVAHSSGNFAQAVALAAKQAGVKAWIVMPENSSEVKKQAVVGYGGILVECENTLPARDEMAEKVRKEHGAEFLHPSDDIRVILGQGTSGMELLEEHPDLDVLMTPVGGGGLVAGCGLAAKFHKGNCEVIAGEPFIVDDAFRSLASGKIELNTNIDTIADGLRTELGPVNFPIIQDTVSRIIRVDEDEIVSAMRLIWSRMKLIIEPSCAVPVAALLREKEKFANQKVGIVLSGGNVDLDKLPW